MLLKYIGIQVWPVLSTQKVCIFIRLKLTKYICIWICQENKNINISISFKWSYFCILLPSYATYAKSLPTSIYKQISFCNVSVWILFVFVFIFANTSILYKFLFTFDYLKIFVLSIVIVNISKYIVICIVKKCQLKRFCICICKQMSHTVSVELFSRLRCREIISRKKIYFNK